MATSGSLFLSSSYPGTFDSNVNESRKGRDRRPVHLSTEEKGTVDCFEIPLHSSYRADFQSDSSQMLAKTWSQWDIYLLLAGV